MSDQTKTQSPYHRVKVAEGVSLQVYLRDGHGGKVLMNLPGPLDFSLVHVKPENK